MQKTLAKALNRPDRSQGGCLPYDAGIIKILVLQALTGCRMYAEFQILDRRVTHLAD